MAYHPRSNRYGRTRCPTGITMPSWASLSTGPILGAGWAPAAGEYRELIAREGRAAWFRKNPYAEWYLNSLRIEGSPTASTTTGPTARALPTTVLSRYLTSRSLPGIPTIGRAVPAGRRPLCGSDHQASRRVLLWPSRHPNPTKRGNLASRDLVGEWRRSARPGDAAGLYYSGDWTGRSTRQRCGASWIS